MKVNTIPFICETAYFPRFMIHSNEMANVGIGVIPLNKQTHDVVLRHPTHRAERLDRYNIVSDIMDFTKNGVRYS